MAGLRHDRIRRAAHHFAETLLASANQQERSWRTVPLGSSAFELGVNASHELGRMIDGAFLPGTPQTSQLRLAVLHQDEARLPSTLWARSFIEQRVEVPAEIADPFRIFFDAVVGVVYVLDRRDGRSVVWVRRSSEVDRRSFITPFRIMLSWLGDLIDVEVVHAAAAIVDGRGVAFSGPSGSGKSTIAIALGLDGDQVVADDCVVIDSGIIHAVYARAKVDPFAQKLLGLDDEVLSVVPDTPRAKRILDLPSMGDSFRPSAPLEMWMNPVRSRTSDWYPITARRMHRLLATDSLREVVGAGSSNHSRLARLAWRVPSCRLLLSPDVAANTAMVRRAVSSMSGSNQEPRDAHSV